MSGSSEPEEQSAKLVTKPTILFMSSFELKYQNKYIHLAVNLNIFVPTKMNAIRKTCYTTSLWILQTNSLNLMFNNS